ncbi:MAG: hypothetical protein O3C40_30000, partial [Planctomycetota bacterium]|nr:hypothetical protein [Planctomycetota bacterium]
MPDHVNAPGLSRDEEVELFFGLGNAENENRGTLAKEGSLRKVGLDLAILHGDHAKFKAVTATTVGPFKFTPRNPLVKVSASNSVDVDVLADGNVESLKSQLADIGMQITGSWQQLISGVIPIDAIDELAALEQVRTARPFMAVASAGAAMTQGDAAQRSDELRSTLGVDGAGVTVGILSDSFNSLGGAAGNSASGDLPALGDANGRNISVRVLNDNPYGGSDEGRALAQVIHDVAPGASLAFATAGLGQAAFAQYISDLRTIAGAD